MASLILKRASASRPSGKWSEDDYYVLANGVVVGRIMRDCRTGGITVVLDTCSWLPPRPQADPRLCGDARGRHGRVRQELATPVRGAAFLLPLRLSTIDRTCAPMLPAPRDAELHAGGGSQNSTPRWVLIWGHPCSAGGDFGGYQRRPYGAACGLAACRRENRREGS